MGDNASAGFRKFLIIVLIVTFTASSSFIGQVLAEDKKIDAPSDQGQPKVQEEVKTVEAAPAEPGNVTVNFKGADIKTVLAYISEVAGVDIVSAPDIKGVIDLKLTNKPWRAALDIIVRNYGFAYEREGDIIRVVTLSGLKQEELSTQAFNLNYSKSKDVVASLNNMLGDRGKVMYDDRTNTVLVTDIPTNIYRIGQIIERLDKRTEQVLIEARIIETVLGDDEKLGIDWNVKITASGAKIPITFPFDTTGIAMGWRKPLSKFVPLSKVATETASVGDQAGAGAAAISPVIIPAADFPSIGAGSQNFPFSLITDFKFGTLDFTEFSAVLEMLKQRSDTDTVSNPRIATLNNNKATINVGDVLNFPKFERNSTTGKMEITGYVEKNSGIILNVTPHVNDNGDIAIELVPEITEYLGSQPIAPGSDIFAPLFRTRQANTQVMIKNGQTIFIGGLITDRNVDRRNKLPFLGDLFGDIPGLGLLFSHKDIVKQRVELIFFITVNIMSPDKAIEGSPLPNKAYVPMFTDTQRGDTAKNKKRLKKTY